MNCVRAIYRACKLEAADPPYDNVTLKIFYQGLLDDSDEVHNAGVVPPLPQDKPAPVVIILPGINVGPESYAWLAEDITSAGHVVVTYSHIAEEMPGYVSLTPGLDIAALMPEQYGERPSATALPAIIKEIEYLNTDGLFKGRLATEQIILLGHSAGGSVALFNANRDWFPQLCAAAAYGAHSAASTVLGFDNGTVLPLPDSVPLLLMAGTCDGVISSSAHRYGDEPGNPLQRVRATFENGISSHRDDCFLVEIDGANHFSFVFPKTDSTGRGFLDWDETGDSEDIREAIVSVLLSFIRFATQFADDSIQEAKNNPVVASFRCR